MNIKKNRQHLNRSFDSSLNKGLNYQENSDEEYDEDGDFFYDKQENGGVNTSNSFQI